MEKKDFRLRDKLSEMETAWEKAQVLFDTITQDFLEPLAVAGNKHDLERIQFLGLFYSKENTILANACLDYLVQIKEILDEIKGEI